MLGKLRPPEHAVREILSLSAFLASLDEDEPPSALGPALAGLWRGLNDDWAGAHCLVQDRDDAEAAWVHAWLHRIEGDQWNAGYWYRRAGREPASGDPTEEGKAIAAALLRG